jgi:hypothetical protein
MGARLAGDTLFGGAIGFAAAGIVAGFEEASGGTVEQHVASLFGLDDQSKAGAAAAAQPQLAAKTLQSAPSSTSGPTSMPTLTAERAAALVGACVAPAAGNPIRPAPAHPVDTIPVTKRSFPARSVKSFPQPVQQLERMPDKAASSQQPTEPTSARLARRIAEAQRAQSGLLIANLPDFGAVPQLTASGEDSRTGGVEGRENRSRTSPLPFRNHPYMRPVEPGRQHHGTRPAALSSGASAPECPCSQCCPGPSPSASIQFQPSGSPRFSWVGPRVEPD